MQEPKISACVPDWVSKSIKAIMDKYSPYNDALDLGLFERSCINQAWLVDQIILGTSVADCISSNDSATMGGDIIRLCVVESINKVSFVLYHLLSHENIIFYHTKTSSFIPQKHMC
jgi:hypothetical protein